MIPRGKCTLGWEPLRYTGALSF